jgi:hypothetical protein
MRVFKILGLLSVAAFLSLRAPGQQTADIHRILPLHSTRSDVEQQFGRSLDSCHCAYRTPKETIAVDYAIAPCKGPLHGWNVPKDTVLAFRVTPKAPLPFSEIELDPNRFVQTRSQDDNLTFYYTNVIDGVKYAVQDNHVIYIRYLPSTKDKQLRCAGFPTYDGGIAEYIPFDGFIMKNEVDTSARLDNFAVQLSQGSSWNGYIIAYAGKIARRGEGRTLGEWARRYMVEKRNIPSNRIFAIDGGFREVAGYDLFLLADTLAPPTATPTVPSNEVRIVNGAGKTSPQNSEQTKPHAFKKISTECRPTN